LPIADCRLPIGILCKYGQSQSAIGNNL